MAIAENHAERVAGLCSMASSECDGDMVAAFASLIDAACAVAMAGEISPSTARERVTRNFRTMMGGVQP